MYKKEEEDPNETEHVETEHVDDKTLERKLWASTWDEEPEV